MYRFLPFLFLAIFSYGTINTNVLLAPEMDAPMLETTTEHDLFSPLPVYQVDSPRQVVQAEGWTGVADFSAARNLSRLPPSFASSKACQMRALRN